MIRLDNKVVFITGGAGLIGSEVASSVVRSRGTVVIADLESKCATKVHENGRKQFGYDRKILVSVDIS
jgi:NAD(P)-dependent dehydrogenase (short-subunit alcohol dehydrogenase family)